MLLTTTFEYLAEQPGGLDRTFDVGRDRDNGVGIDAVGKYLTPAVDNLAALRVGSVRNRCRRARSTSTSCRNTCSWTRRASIAIPQRAITPAVTIRRRRTMSRQRVRDEEVAAIVVSRVLRPSTRRRGRVAGDHHRAVGRRRGGDPFDDLRLGGRGGHQIQLLCGDLLDPSQ